MRPASPHRVQSSAPNAPVAQLAEAHDSKSCQCEFESHRGHSPTRYFLSTAACPHAVLPHLPRRDPGRWHRRPTMPEGLLEPFQHLPPRAPTEHLRTYPRGVASTAAHTDEP